MKPFLDSSAIIIGMGKPNSNSSQILHLVFDKKLYAYTCPKVMSEVHNFFSRRRNPNYAFCISRFLSNNIKVIPTQEFQEHIDSLQDKINHKDLHQLACSKAFNLPLVAYDRDFEEFENYKTPRQLIIQLGYKPNETEY